MSPFPSGLSLIVIVLLSLPGSEGLESSYGGAMSCYVGVDSDYVASVCSECLPGVPCLCLKVEDGAREERRCWVNPHNAITAGCRSDFVFNGRYVQMCACHQDLCNRASNSEPILALLGALFASLFVKFAL